MALGKLRNESNTKDRSEPEAGAALALSEVRQTPALLTAFDGSRQSLAHVPRRLFKMTTELFGYRVKAYRDENAGGYFLPVESCGRLMKYKLHEAFPGFSFDVKTRRFADGQNVVHLFTDAPLTLESQLAMRKVAQVYVGFPINRATGIVTIEPPLVYGHAPVYCNCSEVVFDVLKA